MAPDRSCSSRVQGWTDRNTLLSRKIPFLFLRSFLSFIWWAIDHHPSIPSFQKVIAETSGKNYYLCRCSLLGRRPES